MKNEMTLLLFSVMGTRFALDIQSVTAMLPMDLMDKDKKKIIWFHEKIDFLQMHEKPVIYDFPRALAIASGKESFCLIIDNPHDMPVVVPRIRIRPFPALVKHFTSTTPLRGVCFVDNDMVFLVDILKFSM
jgi:hypothetical protein